MRGTGLAAAAREDEDDRATVDSAHKIEPDKNRRRADCLAESNPRVKVDRTREVAAQWCSGAILCGAPANWHALESRRPADPSGLHWSPRASRQYASKEMWPD